MKYPVLLSEYKAIAQKKKRGISMFLQNKKETVKKDNKLNTIIINEYNVLKNNLPLLLMCLPGVVLLIIFSYLPMFGITIAFKDFNVVKGFLAVNGLDSKISSFSLHPSMRGG